MKIAVFTDSKPLFEKISGVVPTEVATLQHVTCAKGEFPAGVAMALVDGKWCGSAEKLQQLCERLAAGAVYTVLIDDETHIGDSVPESLSEGIVDDLLLTPIRPMELLGKIKHVSHLARVKELASVNAGIKTLIEKFEEDIRTARAIQRSLIPEKFPPVHGFKVTHKYLSGFKSGGDYLDFFEFEDKTHIGILMSDSSGYGLSSAFMSVILRLAVKLSRDEARSPGRTIARIFEELQVTMKPTENLSIFLGILNRKTFELTYASAGSIRFFRHTESDLSDLSHGGGALTKGQGVSLADQTIVLNPGERLVVMSDGFAETFKSNGDVEQTFGELRAEEPIALINDLTYRIKRDLDSDDMPDQDCSVMIVDVEKRAMRLAK